MSDISEFTALERALAKARERRDIASRALRAKHVGGEWAAYDEATEALLTAERALAAARAEEHAVPLEFPVRWNTGTPFPHLLTNDHRTLLVFLVKTVDPSWDGTYATTKSPSSGECEPLALVEFERCIAAKLGSPNDEVLEGHPLAGRGLAPYTAQRVIHSRWLAELQQINSVHRSYNAEWWTDRQHYVLWFHDKTFECIAERFTVSLHTCSMAEMLAEACRRIVT